MDSMPAARVPIENVIALLNASTVLVSIVAIGFTLVGLIAVWRTGQDGASSFFRMFERLQVLQLLTVMLVVASATVLALLGILNSNGITGILSGVAGYVLGGLNGGVATPKSLPGPAAGTAKPKPAHEDAPSRMPD